MADILISVSSTLPVTSDVQTAATYTNSLRTDFWSVSFGSGIVNATVQPSVVTIASTVLVPIVNISSTISANLNNSISAVVAPAVLISSSIAQSAVVNIVSATIAPNVNVDCKVNADLVSLTSSVTTPVIDLVNNPTVLASLNTGAFALVSSTIAADTTIVPSAQLHNIFAVVAPAVTTDSSANIVILPSAIDIISSILSVNVFVDCVVNADLNNVTNLSYNPNIIGTCTISADLVSVTPAVLDVTITGSSVVSPSVLDIALSTYTTNISADALYTSAVVGIIAAILDPSITIPGSVTYSASVLSTISAILDPTISSTALIDVALQTITSSTLSPDITADANIVASLVTILSAIQDATISADANVLADLNTVLAQVYDAIYTQGTVYSAEVLSLVSTLLSPDTIVAIEPATLNITSTINGVTTSSSCVLTAELLQAVFRLKNPTVNGKRIGKVGGLMLTGVGT